MTGNNRLHVCAHFQVLFACLRWKLLIVIAIDNSQWITVRYEWAMSEITGSLLPWEGGMIDQPECNSKMRKEVLIEGKRP